MPTTTINFDGLGNGFSGFSVAAAPPDPDLSVGPNHVVQIVNTSYAVFDKNGTVLQTARPTNSLWAGFGGGCETTNDGDGLVRYDRAADRWVITQFSVNDTNGPFYQCVAVSTTADPRGAFARYAFQYGAFPDQPKLSVWPDAYYFTYDMFPNLTYGGALVCALDRAKMLAAQPASQQCFGTTTDYGGLLAGDLDGSTPPPIGSPAFVAALGTGNTSLAFWKFHVDWTIPANSTFVGPTTISVATYTPLCDAQQYCVVQPNTSQKLEGLGDRLMYRMPYRYINGHESLVLSHSVVGPSGLGSGVRWYELRTPATTPSVYQSGTYVPDSNFRWMGSMAMDRAGDIAAGFSLSGPSVNPSIHYAGRQVGDPLGTLPQAEGTIINGGGTQSGASALGRWGDYTSMAVDPSDDCTFWYTNQYQSFTGTFSWSTRIGSFRFPSCVTAPTAEQSPTDFDDDGQADLAVYRPSIGAWLPKDSSTGNLDQTYFGAAGDIPLPGDYDGIGKTEPAVYRPSTGAWFVRNPNTGVVTQAYFGNAADDVPIPADYDGDGVTDLAVYRPSAGLWLVRGSSHGDTSSRYFGAPGSGDIPVPADYTGDRKADIAIYRQAAGLWFVMDSATDAVTQTRWGNSADDVPVSGRYDADGKTDIAVYRPSAGAWFVINSTGGTNQSYWGSPGDAPVPGDYDGDGRIDFAVFRRSIGAWFIQRTTGGTAQSYWGNTTNDVPLQLPYAVRHRFFPAL